MFLHIDGIFNTVSPPAIGMLSVKIFIEGWRVTNWPNCSPVQLRFNLKDKLLNYRQRD